MHLLIKALFLATAFIFTASFGAETMTPCFYKPHADYFGDHCTIKVYHCHKYERLLDEEKNILYWAETSIYYPNKKIKRRR